MNLLEINFPELSEVSLLTYHRYTLGSLNSASDLSELFSLCLLLFLYRSLLFSPLFSLEFLLFIIDFAVCFFFHQFLSDNCVFYLIENIKILVMNQIYKYEI